MEVTEAMVDRFLAWELPQSVCVDLCAAAMNWPNRHGTNLLTATEAREMLEAVLNGADPESRCEKCGESKDADAHQALNPAACRGEHTFQKGDGND